MTPIEFAEKYGLTVSSPGEGDSREIGGVYCCDLLSMVMGRASENDAFLTVMGNVNTVAVAVLADVSCVILCEGIQLDEPTLGVDVPSTHRIHDYIRALGSMGKTVIVATNIMAEADALCDEVIIIDHGRRICAGTPQALKEALGSGSIVLRFKAEAAPADAVLKERLGVFHYDKDGAVIVEAPQGERDLARILDRLADMPLEGITLQQPSLDDVFLHHTGRNLRE